MVESRSSRWTPQEDALLRRMAEASVRPEIIAIKLNRTVHAVKARAYMIGARFTHSGLAGRTLTSSNPNRLLYDARAAHDHSSETEKVMVLGEIKSALVDDVRRVCAPMFMLF